MTPPEKKWYEILELARQLESKLADVGFEGDALRYAVNSIREEPTARSVLLTCCGLEIEHDPLQIYHICPKCGETRKLGNFSAHITTFHVLKAAEAWLKERNSRWSRVARSAEVAAAARVPLQEEDDPLYRMGIPENRTFMISEKEAAYLVENAAPHFERCPQRDMPWYFNFVQTGIGTRVVARCGCGYAIDITNYDSW